jgi:GntR family transcriptional repressor for pyruvate dehydrogenase complex
MESAVRKISAVDELANSIKDKIHAGEFLVHHRFPPQKQMAADYGVGVSTVREAMGKLITLGYLSAKQGVGTVVENINPVGVLPERGKYVFLTSSQVFHFVEIRLCLERFALRLAAREITDEQLATLEAHIAQQKMAYAKDDFSVFANLDKAFHKEIFHISRNPILIQFFEIIKNEYFIFIEEITSVEAVMHSAISYHGRIIQALRDRDPLSAEKILFEHIWEALKLSDSIYTQNRLEELFEYELKLL